MRFRQFQPGGAAAQFIERYWVLECAREESGGVQRVVPDGSAELILNLEDPMETLQDGVWRRQPRSFLAGQLTGPLLLRQNGAARMIGVRFTAEGVGRFFGGVAAETTARMAPIGDLSPALSRALNDACATGRIAAIECALVEFERRHGRSDELVREAVRRISAPGSPPDVARLARSLGVSLRQMQRRFTAQVGLGPKHFARMRRFQRVFAVVEEGNARWAAVAAECGYYDQAHLIRDFKEFSGETPAVLTASDDLARHFLRRPVAFFQDARGVVG